jgi:copper chaperone CopZ
MKSVSRILVVITVLLSSISSFAQIKNARTETVKINGNCGMCKSNIENAGNVQNVANVIWNLDAKIATLKYDSLKTNKDEILQRIALAGYDNENFRASDNIYLKLPKCCQYKRELKAVTHQNDFKRDSCSNHKLVMPSTNSVKQYKLVLDNYFSIKDALVKSDGISASKKAIQLTNVIKTIEMDKLNTEGHNVWMKVMKDLLFDSEHISETKDVAHQRKHFKSLSSNMYVLIKNTNPEIIIYYQYCPMYNGGKGANWLSKENIIKNPYFGDQMLTCGRTIETIR